MSEGPDRFEVACPAKVNLHLEVGERRSDGFHELRTVYQALELSDGLTVERAASGIALEVSGPRAEGVPSDESNLVLKAARALAREAGLEIPGARLRLVKRVPAGAGLGGGSSDAASTLLALRRMWSLDLPPETMQRLAAALGSDVPFFLTGGTATGTGRGEIVTPEPDLPPLGVLIAWPLRGLGTSRIFRAFDEGGTPRKPLTAGGTLPYNEDTFMHLHRGRKVVLHNDLFVVAVRLMPLLHEIRAGLEALDPLAVSMTGSGSALYALFPDAAAAASAARDFRATGTEAIVTAFRPRQQDSPG